MNYKGIRIPETGKFLLVETGCWDFESEIQLKESKMTLTIRIRSPSSTARNPESKTVLNSLTLERFNGSIALCFVRGSLLCRNLKKKITVDQNHEV